MLVFIKRHKVFFIIYLICGVLFQLSQHWSFNPVRLSTWANVVAWLPLLIVAFLWYIIGLLLLAIIILWIASMMYPQFRQFLYNIKEHGVQLLRRN